MIGRRIVIAALVPACVLAVSLAVPAASPAAALTAKDRQMRQAILVLRGYVDRKAGATWCEYPLASGVRRGGVLDASVWPVDPWTGAPLTPGTGRGHFVYRVSADRRAYSLTGYLSRGPYVVRGAMSREMKLAYDHRSREGMALILQYVALWAEMHGGAYPPAAEVDRRGAVGEQPMMLFWPSDPWTHAAMAQGSGPGRFVYALLPDGAYAGHLQLAIGKGMQFASDTMEPLRQVWLAAEDATTIADVRVLQGYVDEWALLHGGALPAVDQVAPTGAVGQAHDFWPTEPYDGSRSQMLPGVDLGEFTYAVDGDGAYTLSAPLAATGAGSYSVTATPPAAP